MSAEQPVLNGEPDSEVSSSASSDARLDWLMLTAARPAVVQVGDRRLRTDQRVALELAAEAVREVLAGIVGRRVRYGWRGVAAPSGEPAFTALIELGSAEVALTLDEPLARLLIDALTSDLVRLRGVGPPTEAELGVLEYVVVACLDRVGQLQHERWPAPVLKGFVDADGFQRWQTEAGAGAITASVAAAGGKGRLQVWMAEPVAAALAAGAVADGAHALTRAVPYTQVRARVALPPVTLSPEEVRALEPGDVILLGLTRLEDGVTTMRLVTDTGWELAPLLALEDHPSALRLRCDTVEPRVPESEQEPTGSGALHVLATLGELTLTLAQLAELSSATWLDMPKRSDAPVMVYAGSVPLGRGELVRVGEELGVRLIEGAGDEA